MLLLSASLLVYLPIATTLGGGPSDADGGGGIPTGHGIDTAERLQLREKVREMFYHGYNNYLEHGAT